MKVFTADLANLIDQKPSARLLVYQSISSWFQHVVWYSFERQDTNAAGQDWSNEVGVSLEMFYLFDLFDFCLSAFTAQYQRHEICTCPPLLKRGCKSYITPDLRINSS